MWTFSMAVRVARRPVGAERWPLCRPREPEQVIIGAGGSNTRTAANVTGTGRLIDTDGCRSKVVAGDQRWKGPPSFSYDFIQSPSSNQTHSGLNGTIFV